MKIIHWHAFIILMIVSAFQTVRKNPDLQKVERGDTLMRVYTEEDKTSGNQAIFLEKSINKKRFYAMSFACQTEYLSKSTYSYSEDKEAYITHWTGVYVKGESNLSLEDSTSIAALGNLCSNGKKANCSFFQKYKSFSYYFPNPKTVIQTDSLFFYDDNGRLNRCKIQSSELNSKEKNAPYRELVNKTIRY